MPHLARFTLSDMVRTSADLRQLGGSAPALDVFGAELVTYLREALVDPGTGDADTAMVRFYKTHAFRDLPADLQAFAADLLGEHEGTPSMKCLTLLGSTGVDPAWSDVRASRNHRAVPLPSAEVVARLPMISQLIHQFGLDLSTVIEPDPEVLMELDEKTYNVFFVADAKGSSHIPAQDFVEEHGIVSALGFGGMLPTGDLFAVVMFSTVAIPLVTAELFRTLAVSVKVALLPLMDGPLFDDGSGDDLSINDQMDTPRESRVRKLAVEQLLEVHERIVTDQALRLEEAWDAERARAGQLRALAAAAIFINSSVSSAEMLERVTDQARIIVGARRAVTSMTVGTEAEAINAESYAESLESSGDDTPPARGKLEAPLVGREGNNLGLIQLTDKSNGGEFNAEDEAILVQLAQMASITIENAQLYEREHQIAAELQRSLLPQEMPNLHGIDVAARYYAGAAGVDVGGDWYDMFEIGEGSVAVVLGDVAGRGVAAASVMGQLRMALRAYALDERAPSAVVARLDHLLQQLGLVEFATLAYGVWTPAIGALDLVLAGHPAPLILSPGGEISFASAEPCGPLGGLPGAAFPSTRISVERGSTLLLFSDGLVEARDLPLGAGLERLRTFVAAAPRDLEGLCDHVATAALSADADDDVTLLAVRERQE